LLTHIAKCCKPLPGEDIVGYVTRGRGVTIHRQDCPNILRIQSDDEERERLIAVDWGAAKQRTFPVQVRVNVYDRTGLLHDISGVLKRYGINMDAVSTGKRNQDNVLPLYLTLEVPDFATLTRVLRRVEQITNVISTRRIS
jgi:GTP pyrophosphokinase